jgi:large subunit ribosomal protein L10
MTLGARVIFDLQFEHRNSSPEVNSTSRPCGDKRSIGWYSPLQIFDMPPRLQHPSKVITSILRIKHIPSRCSRPYATAAVAIEPPPSDAHTIPIPTPIAGYPRKQPPSHKPAEFRKTQLLRQYASLLKSNPLMLLFQHNNIRSNEWVCIRRELAKALHKVDEAEAAAGKPYEDLASGIKIQTIQTGIFAAALRVVEFYRPETQPGDGTLTHALSRAAHDAVSNKKRAHALAPLLAGPLVVLTFPSVSPQHMKAALSILAPSAPQFPAPTRKANPGWHDATVQSGLQKLLLMGARVEGRVFDVDGTRWVGGIEGGLDGLRGQLVAMLQSMGANVTNTLESAAKNLYFTVESRRTMLEDEGKPQETKDEAPKEE